MAKLKRNNLVKKICDNCHGNGYIRVATGDTSIDFRNNIPIMPSALDLAFMAGTRTKK